MSSPNTKLPGMHTPCTVGTYWGMNMAPVSWGPCEGLSTKQSSAAIWKARGIVFYTSVAKGQLYQPIHMFTGIEGLSWVA